MVDVGYTDVGYGRNSGVSGRPKVLAFEHVGGQ